MQTCLITGGAGFIGSNFVPYILDRFPHFHFIVLDKLTYAGSLSHLQEVKDHQRFQFIQGDICDFSLVASIFENHNIQGVFHFAAESHVDNSISDPGEFVKTNINGTFNLIEAARRKWLTDPFVLRAGYEKARFLHVSTDEVYGSLGPTGFFTEHTAYAPNSPYSASKASSDMLVRSYFHTYGLNVVTTNCSNNYGPKQHSEKLIPTIIRKALAQEKIPIYGDGKNVRDWLYVLDHCYGLELAFMKGKSGETYNVGGRNELSNLEVASEVCRLLDEKRPLRDGKSYSSLIGFVKDRPGHDRRYAIDPTKIEKELGWKAKENFQSGLRKTLDWYLTQS
jgi:dTDP-glucose 4,6-dehydratase